MFIRLIRQISRLFLPAEFRVFLHSECTLSAADVELITGFDIHDHTKLPYEYVRASNRFVLVHTIGGISRVAGGVLFCHRPDSFRTRQLVAYDLPVNSLEANCLWMHPKVPRRARLGFWLAVCAALLEVPPQTIYFSYEIKKRGLDRFYRSFAPLTIYQGPVPCLPGMNPQKQYVERVACFKTADLRWRLPGLVLRRLARDLIRPCPK